MLNRWIEDGLLDVLGEDGVGCIAFSPLAQGMLTNKYLNGIPEGSRAAQRRLAVAGPAHRADARPRPGAQRDRVGRGQSLAQMALAWALRDERVTSVLIGASSVAQLDDNLGALDRLGVHRRRARRDRQARGRGRDQPLEALERRLIGRTRTRMRTHSGTLGR